MTELSKKYSILAARCKFKTVFDSSFTLLDAHSAVAFATSLILLYSV